MSVRLQEKTRKKRATLKLDDRGAPEYTGRPHEKNRRTTSLHVPHRSWCPICGEVGALQGVQRADGFVQAAMGDVPCHCDQGARAGRPTSALGGLGGFRGGLSSLCGLSCMSSPGKSLRLVWVVVVEGLVLALLSGDWCGSLWLWAWCSVYMFGDIGADKFQ